MSLKNFCIALSALIFLILGACSGDSVPEGPPPPPPLPDDIPGLITMLKEPQQTRSNEIMDALVARGSQAIPMIVSALEGDEKFEEPAMYAISKFGADAVQPCIDALGSQYMHVRYAAIGALGIIGPEAEPAADPLIDLYTRTLKSEQRKIMETLQKITISPTAITLIRASMSVEDLRFDAMRTLGKWGPDANIAMDALADYLGHENDQTRVEAIDALGKIGFNDKVISGMTKIVSGDPEPRVRKEAVEILGQYGPGAAGATTALIGALKDADKEIQEFAARALGEIAPESRAAIPDLVIALTAENLQTRREAAIALGKFGPEASSALDALKKLESDESEQEYIRKSATDAIAAIEPTPAE